MYAESEIAQFITIESGNIIYDKKKVVPSAELDTLRRPSRKGRVTLVNHTWLGTNRVNSRCKTAGGQAERAECFRLAGRNRWIEHNFSVGVRDVESERSNLRSLKRFAGAQHDNWLRDSWLGFPIIWHPLCLQFARGWYLVSLPLALEWRSVQRGISKLL